MKMHLKISSAKWRSFCPGGLGIWIKPPCKYFNTAPGLTFTQYSEGQNNIYVQPFHLDTNYCMNMCDELFSFAPMTCGKPRGKLCQCASCGYYIFITGLDVSKAFTFLKFRHWMIGPHKFWNCLWNKVSDPNEYLAQLQSCCGIL